MKRVIRIALWATIVVAVFAMIGCSGATETTIEDRIDSFESDINNSRSDVYKNFHPDSALNSSWRDTNTFAALFPEDETFTITISSTSNNTATGTISSSQDTYSDDDISFSMKNDPEEGGGMFGGAEVDNWKIMSISGVIDQP